MLVAIVILVLVVMVCAAIVKSAFGDIKNFEKWLDKKINQLEAWTAKQKSEKEKNGK